MNERRTRRFSQAIAEGDGISVLVEVSTAEAARAAESQGAAGVVARAGVYGLRDATELPILWCVDGGPDAAGAAGADACLFVAGHYEEDWERLADDQTRALELGLDSVVEVRDEEELEDVLEHVDPEIVLLAGAARESPAEVLDHLLELLPDVPAGKLAVADLATASDDDVGALEVAGIDAVVLATRDVTALVGDEPPPV